MTINWEFALQQLGMALLSGAVVATVLAALRRAGDVAPPSALRLWLELPSFSVLLFALGLYSRELGWGLLLPNLAFAWTVGVALTMYWMAIWWPLRVLRRHTHLRHHFSGRLTLAAAIVAVLGAIWSCFVETHLIEVEYHTVDVDAIGTRAVRIAHISDTQLIDLGPRENELVEIVNRFEPHLIVFSGDYIAGTAGETTAIAAMRSILQRLQASHGIYATPSDSDVHRQRLEIFAGLPVHYMVNDFAMVDVDGVRVRIGSLDHIEPDWVRIGEGATDDELFVVACHTPDFAEATGQLLPLADLYLCGHTHGGQVNVPFFGPPITMSRVARDIAAGGVFATTTGLPMFVSRGIGTEGDYAPRFRFNCRPQVFLLTVRGSAASR